jgi:Transglycosylase
VKWSGRIAWGAAVAVVAVAALAPIAGGWWVRTRLLPRVSARLGRPVTADAVRVRWGEVELTGLTIDGKSAAPPLYVPRVRARLRMGALLAGRADVKELTVEHARIELIRGGTEDNVTALLDALRAPRPAAPAGGAGGGRVHVDCVRVVDLALALAVESLGEVEIGRVDGDLWTEGAGELRLSGVGARMGGGPRVFASRVVVGIEMRRAHLAGLPTITVEGGAASPVGGLVLTGIAGTVRPDPLDGERAIVDVHGSYGGSDTPLWNATGWLRPRAPDGGAGKLKLRAERFRLSQLESVWNREGGVTRVLSPRDAEVDARLDLDYTAGALKYTGAFHLAGLTIAHPMLGPVPVHHLGFDAHAAGSLDLRARRLKLDEATVDYRNVHATFTADVENLGPKPRFAATLQVRPLPCQVALAALPPELTPALQGFKLSGTFSTDVHVAIDMADLDAGVDLGGRVGIEGCKALDAPAAVVADRLLATFEQTVEFERGKWRTFLVGAENPDYVPYDQIATHLVNSIMTTEDNGFFRHKGFIPAEFRSALQQNLQRGYFRLGASSITMQMIKNVLLTREKTLSRKLQEMFLTWYVEHNLTKERILEIYFNVIEFGPDLFGIGRAARHYFGKSAKDLAPQEAAFFSSILPNPKRRYVQYCHAAGTLDAKWDAYVKRIMRRSHERGRLTDAEFQLATTTPVKFDRAEATSERECMALVKRLTTPLVPTGTAPTQARN